MTPRMGRSNRLNFLHWNDDKHEVTCGCFKGTLDELEVQVREVHGEDNHGVNYLKQIKIMRELMLNV